MNPFARLIEPTAPVPQPASMQGRVHVLSDDRDPQTDRPASKPGPKQSQAGTQALPLRPIVGLPRFELRYERDESVTWAEVLLPVMVAVTTPATAVTAAMRSGPKKTGSAGCA